MSIWIRLCGVVIFASGLAACSAPQSLSQNMQTLNLNYKAFQQATASEQALDALNNMKQASLSAQKQKPANLSATNQTSDDFQAYQDLYTQLNAEILQAQRLTQAGQLEEAKQHLKKIDAIKKQGHQRYKP